MEGWASSFGRSQDQKLDRAIWSQRLDGHVGGARDASLVRHTLHVKNRQGVSNDQISCLMRTVESLESLGMCVKRWE